MPPTEQDRARVDRLAYRAAVAGALKALAALALVGATAAGALGAPLVSIPLFLLAGAAWTAVMARIEGDVDASMAVLWRRDDA